MIGAGAVADLLQRKKLLSTTKVRKLANATGKHGLITNSNCLMAINLSVAWAQGRRSRGGNGGSCPLPLLHRGTAGAEKCPFAM